MNRSPSVQLQDTLNQIKEAEAELEALRRQLEAFEDQVDARLGSLLDQLGDLNSETAILDADLRHIREERLYGKDLMSYEDGAPRPSRAPKLSDLPTGGIADRRTIHTKHDQQTACERDIPDIKALYRKLARRYHPDLARSESDRASSTRQMAEINRAYQAGELKTLMRLAGIGLPYGVELPETISELRKSGIEPMSETERAGRKLKAIRQEISRMSNLPIVKLSLDVKLARHQGRDLLREMAGDLQYRIGRKLAERDYLRAQVNLSIGGEGKILYRDRQDKQDK